MRKADLILKLDRMHSLVEDSSKSHSPLGLAWWRKLRWEFLNHLEKEFDRDKLW